MISVQENGKLGMLLPIIQAEFGLEKADELCLAAIEVDSLMDLGQEYKKMLETAIDIIDNSKKKAQKQTQEKYARKLKALRSRQGKRS